MGEPRLRVREPDDSSEDSTARVRSERHDQVAQEVLRRLRVVEAPEAVEAFQEVVDERGHAHEVLAAGAGDEDVLGPEFEDLIFSLERTSGRIPRITETMRVLHGDARLPRGEVRERKVRHIESGRAILEYVDLVLRPEDALLDRLRGLVLRDHALHRLDFGRPGFSESLQGGPQHFGNRDALPCWPVARGRVAAARTFRQGPPLSAGGTNPKSDLHVDGLFRSRFQEQTLSAAFVSAR